MAAAAIGQSSWGCWRSMRHAPLNSDGKLGIMGAMGPMGTPGTAGLGVMDAPKSCFALDMLS